MSDDDKPMKDFHLPPPLPLKPVPVKSFEETVPQDKAQQRMLAAARRAAYLGRWQSRE